MPDSDDTVAVAEGVVEVVLDEVVSGGMGDGESALRLGEVCVEVRRRFGGVRGH